MGGIIEIQDLVANSSENWGDPYTVALIEGLTPGPSGPTLYDHNISINYEYSYISSFVKWSTVGATAANVFNGIENLIAVYNKDGLVHYANPNLSSSNTLTTLTDEEVYQVVKDSRTGPSILGLKSGEKVLENGEEGFAFTFATGTDNWFPWCIDIPRPLRLVLRNNTGKITKITDSAGRYWTQQGNANNSNTLQEFEPGQGYIVVVNTGFTLTVLKREDRSPTLAAQYPIYPPVFDTGEIDTTTLPHLNATISAKTLKNAISQFPVHSDITALKQSEVNRYKDTESIPGSAEIKTFYDARGLDVTFDTLMKLSDDYDTGHGAVYDRLDFQADYKTKVKNLEYKTVDYKLEFRNSFNTVIGGGNTITASRLESFSSNEKFIFRVTNPQTSSVSKSINFTITSDGNQRKFAIGDFRGNPSLIRSFSQNITSFSNITIDGTNPYTLVDSYDIIWVKDERITITQLYCSNPT